MEQQISELTMLLIYLTGWEETPKKSKKEKKVFRAFIGYRYEALQELENQGLIRLTPGGKSLTVTEKGKQAAGELKNGLLDKTNDRFLKGLDIQPWTKSLLPCHIPGDDKEYPQYIELIELMRMPEIEKIILGKLADLKIVAKGAIKQFFEGLK
jgi:DNA-binding PadR family transcriptional regulator